MNVESIFKQAALNYYLCEIVDWRGKTRIVEPYMVYRSSTGKRLFHCYQISGYSWSGKHSGWKNPRVKSFIRATELDQPFITRSTYNPSNRKRFTTVFFSLPR